MFYTCSLDLAAACSPSDFLGIPAAVLSKSSPIQSACCSSDSVMVCFPSFQSPTTFEYSMADPGRVSLRSWLAASRAKTSALPVREPDSAESVPDCGPTLPGSLARWNPSSSSWRTRQRSLTGGLVEFSETLPRWGSMRNMELFQRKMPSGLEAHRLSITAAKESGSLAVSVHSPASNEPGISPGRLVTKDGEPFKIGERAYDKETGRLAQVGLSQQVLSLPTPGASKACNDTTLTCSGDERDKPNKLGWAVVSMPTPRASDNNQGVAANPMATLTTAVINVPTPHGFGHGNGSSGNERGFAVTRLTAPTPTVNGNYNKKGASATSGDGLETFVRHGKRANSNPTDKTKRRVATGQANLSEFIVEHPKTMPTPVSSEVRQGVQVRRKGTKGKQESLTTVATSCEGSLNPDWVEWLMNWPSGWTSLEPIGDAFDEWLVATELRCWHHVEPDIPRTAKNVPNRVARLKAIGNGQVPLAAYLAWTLLMARFDVDNAIPAVDHV